MEFIPLFSHHRKKKGWAFKIEEIRFDSIFFICIFTTILQIYI